MPSSFIKIVTVKVSLKSYDNDMLLPSFNRYNTRSEKVFVLTLRKTSVWQKNIFSGAKIYDQTNTTSSTNLLKKKLIFYLTMHKQMKHSRYFFFLCVCVWTLMEIIRPPFQVHKMGGGLLNYSLLISSWNMGIVTLNKVIPNRMSTLMNSL